MISRLNAEWIAGSMSMSRTKYAKCSPSALYRSTARYNQTFIRKSMLSTVSTESDSATPETTQKLIQKFPSMLYTTVPKTGLTVSRVGFGGYRIRPEFTPHKQALLTAFQSGVNLVDTSSHFGGGLSELLIGDAIQEAIASNEISRDQIVVVSKAGFVHGHPNPFPDQISTGSNGIPHCISPEFLEAELTGSLDRLGLSKIDTFLINSPERMLMSTDKKITKQHLYDMIYRAMEYLDKQVKLGRIGSFGIASNSAHNPSSPYHFSIENILLSDWATHFSTVQTPFNLYERDAMADGLEGTPSLFQVCRERKLFLMTQRPFYSICKGLVRLLVTRSNIRSEDEPAVTNALSKHFEVATHLELELAEHLGVTQEETELLSKFVWAQAMAENLATLTDNEFAAERYFSTEVQPALEKSLDALAVYTEAHATSQGQDILGKWAQSYSNAIQQVMKTVLTMTRIRAFQANIELNDLLYTLAPKALEKNDVLATNMLRINVSALSYLAPASSMIVGMRLPEYVTSVVDAAKREIIDEDSLESIFDNPAMQQ
ncbi:hypothetical protein QVD99_004785 [Batrachochytrium dendrobatidis]|nr:hypothetical protein O5D80_003023 [Batrachochytrium dendrobatidis]KAK5669020.1 hypothetical protein QVD99_004785 [Batrachochytrium dendrobatidis]